MRAAFVWLVWSSGYLQLLKVKDEGLRPSIMRMPLSVLDTSLDRAPRHGATEFILVDAGPPIVYTEIDA